MLYSHVNSRYEITPDCWVVSVLNVDNQWFGLPGHSVLIVEGIGLKIEQQQRDLSGKMIISEAVSLDREDNSSFVRSFDIQSRLFPGQPKSYYLNAKGYLSEIRAFDSHRVGGYTMPSVSYYVDPAKVISMLECIYTDINLLRTELPQGKHPFLFQRWGKNSFFTNQEDGDNCASWCLQKLFIAGIGDGHGKPKPKLVASDSSCLIM